MINARYIKCLIIILAYTLLTAGCGSTASVAPGPDSPGEVLKRFTASLNKGNVNECLTLFAVNAEVYSNTSGLRITGIDSIESLLKNYQQWNHKLVIAGPINVKDDTARAAVNEYDDQFKILGLDKIRSHCECTVYSGRINQLILEIDPQDKALYIRQQSGVIGIVPRETTTGCIITEVKKGSPAENAGLKPGDVIAEVNGETVDKMRTGEVSMRIRGTIGSRVSLTVLRTGWAKPKIISIIRADRKTLSK